MLCVEVLLLCMALSQRDDSLNRNGSQPSISKPNKTLGTHLLPFPGKWVGRVHLQGMTVGGWGGEVISHTKIKHTGLQLPLGN